jgi:hypothetical protein
MVEPFQGFGFEIDGFHQNTEGSLSNESDPFIFRK